MLQTINSLAPSHTDPPGALRGPLRGAFILTTRNLRTNKQAVGPLGPLLATRIGLTMKLHAVAPGGPPEGQCEMTRTRLFRFLPQAPDQWSAGVRERGE